jgi:hypothetical protein
VGFHEVLWDSMRFHEIPWGSMGFYDVSVNQSVPSEANRGLTSYMGLLELLGLSDMRVSESCLKIRGT